MMDRLTLEFTQSLVLKHGRTEVLMSGYIYLYTLWIPSPRIRILKLNFTEEVRIGL